ncbi:hypothetical protein KEGY108214_15355 [Kerstersia gyiorum]
MAGLGSCRQGGLFAPRYAVAEVVSPQQAQQQDDTRQQPGAQRSAAPSGHDADRAQEDRRQRPAQAAGQQVQAEGMPQPGGVDALVDDGVIHRVEHGIAQSCDQRRQDQDRVVGGCADQQACSHEAAQAEPEYAARADTIDDEARRCLPDAGGHEE